MEEQIIDSTMTKDKRLKRLVKEYFRPEDYFLLRDRMIGSGAIGGKACGMLLARKIADTELADYRQYSEPHDSFYIGSDVVLHVHRIKRRLASADPAAFA